MLFASLYNLMRDGLLPDDFMIVASGRSEHSDDEFRAEVDVALAQYIGQEHYDRVAAQALLSRIVYCAAEAGKGDQFACIASRVADRKDRGLAVYMSTPPSLFGPTAQSLAAAGLVTPSTRIAMEKPINDAIGEYFSEQQIFRIDHYLGKEPVQNLLALRFGNALFEPLWRREWVRDVQITVAEQLGVEGRGAFYDKIGALRDMLQNHLLQLLCIVAMEPPSSIDPDAVRDEKLKVLRALRPFTAEMAKQNSVRGQYGGGAVNGEIVKGYTEELGQASDTETFVALKTHIDNWRWAGVPFYLRTGKRMPTRHSEIMIRFKPVAHSIFAKNGFGSGLEPNTLIIRLQPQENIRLTVMAKEPGLDRGGVKLREVGLDVSLTTAFAGQRRRIAYERLLLDLIEGDPTLFVRRDEVEAQWQWIDSLIAGWHEAEVKAVPYAAGNWGPSSAIALIERDGASWHE
jgi:glucose-6-phosphate 1-dehydrogenase